MIAIRNISTLVLYGLLFCAVFWLAQYNFPQSDDFRFEYQFNSEQSILEHIKSEYVNTGSRLGGTTIQIWLFRIAGLAKYQLIPPILLLLFSISVYYVVSGVFKNMKKVEVVSLSSLLLVLYISGMPDFQSAFFWLTASVSTITEILFMFSMGFILHRGIRSLKPLEWIFVLFSFIFYINSGEVHLYLGLILFGLLVVRYVWFERNMHWLMVLSSVLILSTLVLYFASPALYQRIGETQSFEGSVAVKLAKALSFSTLRYASWMMDPRLWLMFGFTLFMSSTQVVWLDKKLSIFRKDVIIKDLLILALPVVGFGATAFFAFIIANEIPGRLLNFNYFLLLFWAIILGWRVRPFLQTDSERIFPIIQMGVVLLISMSVGLKNLYPNYFYSIVRDIVNGEARNFYESQQKRQLLMQSCMSDTCYLPQLEAYPKSFYRYHPLNEVLTEEQFKTKGRHYINEYYVRAFGKKAVFLDSRNTLGYDYYYYNVYEKN